MRQILAALGPLPLGYQGESGAREIRFEKTAEEGSGQWTLLVQRPGDEAPYPAVTEERDGCLIWRPDSTDTAKSGTGLCELRYTEGSSVVKSRVWKTETLPALGQETDPPPPAEGWTGQVISAALRVENALRTAPVISAETGNWLLWNAEQGAYADSGLPARGEKGDTGDRGETGSVSSVNGKSGTAVMLSAKDMSCGEPGESTRTGGDFKNTPPEAGENGLLEVTAVYGKTAAAADGRLLGARPEALCCVGANLLSPAGTASVCADAGGTVYRLTGPYTEITCLYSDGSTETPVPDAEGCFTLSGSAMLTVTGADADTRLCVRGHETEEAYLLTSVPVPFPTALFPGGMHSIRTGHTPAEDEISGMTATKRIAVKRLKDCTLLRSTSVENAWYVTSGMQSVPLPGSNNYVISAANGAGWTCVAYNTLKTGSRDRVMSHVVRSSGRGIIFLDSRYAAFWQANDAEGLKEALGDTEVAWVMTDAYTETAALPAPLCLTVHTRAGGTEEMTVQNGEGPVPDYAARRYASLQDVLERNDRRVSRLISALEAALGGTFTEGDAETVFERSAEG